MPLTRQGSLKTLWLEGTPEQMGEEYGRLLHDEIHLLLDGFVRRSKRLIGLPYSILMEKAQEFIPFIPEHHLREMRALAEASGTSFAEIIAANCLADVDECHMQQLLQCCNVVLASDDPDKPFFAHGRNLDFPFTPEVNRETGLVVIRRPSEPDQLPTLCVTWSGLVGTFTGCNARGMSTGQVSAPTRNPQVGMPIGSQLRLLLESSHCLEEAQGLVEGFHRSHAANIAVADSRTRDALALECAPAYCAARSLAQGYLVVDNLCLTEQGAVNRLSYPTGALRHARAVQMIQALRGEFGTAALMAIMKDRFDMSVGEVRDQDFRQCSTICNFMTAQSALFLHSEGRVLVSTNSIPAPLGTYEEIDLRAVFASAPATTTLVS
ncbi:MAG: C45 family peptidase [FCB group bacterium]|jgi:hypothetical protein|nr:C45 family peptidase [FCB group bacterium]